MKKCPMKPHKKIVGRKIRIQIPNPYTTSCFHQYTHSDLMWIFYLVGHLNIKTVIQIFLHTHTQTNVATRFRIIFGILINDNNK